MPGLTANQTPALLHRPTPASLAGPEFTRPSLVVFSHLRWGFVYQRPQQLLSRLAARGWQVTFIEEPVHGPGPARLETLSALPGVTVVVPYTPVPVEGFHDDQIALLEPLLAVHLQAQRALGGVVWLYTPMALPLMKTAQARVVVYDCMDELTAVKDAPRQLHQREIALTKCADLMFTGGPSLYEAKRELHPRVHCLPSAVDALHFAPPRLRAGSALALRAQALQGALTRPRLGYYGVIDERLDLALVAHLADSRPAWQIVMVGPVVKIDPQGLPQRPNLHWLGMQHYDLLPHLVAGWDLCLMPFAMNSSTRCISPTETLEYMAGEKPVVSTLVHDVVQLYGDMVAVAPAGDDFVNACEALLHESARARQRRGEAMLTTVSSRSWDHTVTAVHLLLQVACREADALLEPAPRAAVNGTRHGVPLHR